MKNIQSVSLPNSLKAIGEAAFLDCSKLKEVRNRIRIKLKNCV